MKPKSQAKKSRKFVESSPIESLRSIAGGVGASLTSDLLEKGTNDMWKQMLGIERAQGNKTGELHEGQELDLSSLSEKSGGDTTATIEAAIDYRSEILHGEKRISKEATQETVVKIAEIKKELAKLMTTIELQMKYVQLNVEQTPQQVGKYHETFYEWLLSVIRTAQMKVEDAGSWLHTFKSKKAKQGYWNMFKKHGTSFGLSNERNVSTQTG